MKIKMTDGHPEHAETYFLYDILSNGKFICGINSKRHLFEEEFLDYYADWCGIPGEGLSLKYKGFSLIVDWK